jgi:hypothetical protein
MCSLGPPDVIFPIVDQNVHTDLDVDIYIHGHHHTRMDLAVSSGVVFLRYACVAFGIEIVVVVDEDHSAVRIHDDFDLRKFISLRGMHLLQREKFGRLFDDLLVQVCSHTEAWNRQRAVKSPALSSANELLGHNLLLGDEAEHLCSLPECVCVTCALSTKCLKYAIQKKN